MSSEVTAVRFDQHPLDVAENLICAPGISVKDAIAPHASRRIDFVDDGKLFEGHFTLHTFGLKSLIQILADRQLEQQVIISDLQDQMNTLRQQTSTMRRTATASPVFSNSDAGSCTGSLMREVDDIQRRVKVLEGFKTLWGLRNEEIDNLVTTYGDPVVTPEEYTACILNLQPFRLMRSEARNSVFSLMERQSSASARPTSAEKGGNARSSRDRSARDDSHHSHNDTHSTHDDSRHARDDSRRARDDSRHARDDSRHARDDSLHARDDSRHARDDSRHARDDSRHARDDSLHARDDSRRARDDSRRARDDSRHAREDSRRARDDSRHAREDSRRARDDSLHSRDDSRRARDDSRRARDDSRRARDDSRRARDDSRRARDDSRGVREEDGRDFRGPVEDTHGPREDPDRDFEDCDEGPTALENRLDAPGRKIKRGGVGAALSSARRPIGASRRSSLLSSELVDAQARDDIEELERFVIQRFKEIERCLGKNKDTTTPLPPPAAASKGGSAIYGKSNKSPVVRNEKRGEASENITDKKDTSSSSMDLKPRKERKAPRDNTTVDQVAREDATAALDQVEQLDKFVTRKLKELSLGISKGMSANHLRNQSGGEFVIPTELKPQGPMVDQMARDDAARSLEFLHDLEEEWGKRWQSLEERLRIIGRATMNKGPFLNAASSSSSTIDRKAREDATLSLMRIQQLEREISALRRFLQKQKLIVSEETGLRDTNVPNGFLSSTPPIAVQQTVTPQSNIAGSDVMVPAPSDEDYQARVHKLEHEVGLRMEEVNRALATLRAVQPGSSLGEFPIVKDAVRENPQPVPGQVVINSKEVGDSYFIGAHQSSSPARAAADALLMMSSCEPTLHTRLPGAIQGQTDILLLRPPQASGYGAPLVARETMGKPSLASSNATATVIGTAQPDEHLTNNRPPHGGDSIAWGSESAVPPSSQKTCEVLTANAADAPAIADHKLTTRPYPDKGEPVSGRGRSEELDQLRSHSLSLRRISRGVPGGLETDFSLEPSALGHSTPCVVFNCAWCSAQKGIMSPKTPKTLR